MFCRHLPSPIFINGFALCLSLCFGSSWFCKCGECGYCGESGEGGRNVILQEMKGILWQSEKNWERENRKLVSRGWLGLKFGKESGFGELSGCQGDRKSGKIGEWFLWIFRKVLWRGGWIFAVEAALQDAEAVLLDAELKV